MRVLVLGGDGYLGWPTALHLSAAGHDVAIVDNFARRRYDEEMGVDTLVPIRDLEDRVRVWKEVSGRDVGTYVGDLTDAAFVTRVIGEFRPESVVHFGEGIVLNLKPIWIPFTPKAETFNPANWNPP